MGIGHGDAPIDPEWHPLAAIEGLTRAILLGRSMAFFVTVAGLPGWHRG